ncbi:MAG: hypothetical protein ACPGUU_00030 [Flavobacteriaceae bacterium]
MKKIYYSTATLIIAIILIANSAQPGIWNAGGSGSFQLLYPEDSIAYKKIQMKSERIFMQLYNGYAVVKGTYNFYNTTKDTLSIKVGYPVNNVFKNIKPHHKLNQVRVDGLYMVRGQVNDSIVPLYKKPNTENDNWYVWNIKYPPKKITKFTVYFLVNTNNAQIINGYNKDYKNAFIYLIETGFLWKSPIEKGEFYTELKEDFFVKNLRGNAPTTLQINNDKNILQFVMTNYGKSPDNNFILTYGEEIPNFNFKQVTKKSDSLFSVINDFSKTNFNDLSFNNINLKSPYKTDSKSGNTVGFLYLLLYYGIPILIIVFTIVLFIWLFKKFKQ